MIVCLFFSLTEVNGQVLDNALINLNAGGVIYDVADDPYHDCYILVGNFTSVNGTAVHNIAFLNKSDLSLNLSATLNTITAINGEIRSVECYMNETTNYFNYRIYLGGNFTSITTTSGTYARTGFAELLSTKSKFLPVTITPFNVSAWNILMDYAGNEVGVNDIYRSADTLILAGNFQFLSSGQPYDVLYNVVGFNGVAHSWIPIFNNPGGSTFYGYGCDFCQVYSVERSGDFYYLSGSDNYLGGSGFLHRYLPDGSYDNTFQPPLCGTGNAVWKSIPITSGADNFIVSTSKYAGSNGTYVHELNDNLVDGPFCAVTDVLPDADGLAKYKNTIIERSAGQFGFYDLNGSYPATASPVITTNTTTYNSALGGLASSDTYGGYGYRRTHVIENYLFISGNALTNVGGTARTGLAAYCLEPHDAFAFTAFDTTICPEDTVTYTIPAVEFADGYKWEFTGTGAFLVNSGPMISAIEMDDTAAYSKQIAFLPNFGQGQLKITPYSLCNGVTKLYSNTVTLNIYSNPLPHVNAGPDTTLTCVRDSVILYGYSDSAVVSYQWVYPFPGPDVPGQYDTITAAGNYVFKVKNAWGCPNFDTVNVSLDTLKPVVILPAGSYDLTCADPEKTFSGSSPTANTTVEWFEPVDSVFFSNPITVNLPGSYYLVATDTLNGCQQSAGIFVYNNYIFPDISVAGYPTLTSVSALDTLTCLTDTLVLTTYSATPNSAAAWIAQDTSVFYGNTLEITTGGFYYLFATESTTGCTNSTGIFILEYQNLPDAQVPDSGLLNCSVDSLILFGSSLSAGAEMEWNGSLISPSSNPLTVYDPGVYYFTATDTFTGCKATDSIVVMQDNSIAVFAGNDTLVCNAETVPLSVNYGGTINGINYLWSNASVLQNTTYLAGATTYAAVEVFGDNGCYGADTVYLNIPPVPVILFEGFKPCDDGPSGSVVATPVSGLEPFVFSIDNGSNFQTSPVFNGLYTGTYPMVVRDSVNCLYNFTAVIDENSSHPTPAFLFSTYNFATDTVVVVDVSNPPADTVVWVFPPALMVLDNNPLSPVILLPDTGSFAITMQAHYGTCVTEVSKMIYASPFDSLAATQYNLNGIKSVQLYPNPTSGNFTVEIEFYKSQRAALVVQDMVGTTFVFNEYDQSLLITEAISLDPSVIDGTYVLKVVSEFDSASITFILAR